MANLTYQHRSVHTNNTDTTQRQTGAKVLQDNRQTTKQLKSLPAQRVKEEEEPLQGKFTNQNTAQLEQQPTAPNNTGLPDNLKTGIESLSGLSMDNVRVHYNSNKPAQLNALAYAQGTDIHVASGQEKHLPHEAWHVVQQMQGRVIPTMQMKTGVNVNDDTGLEHEADVMGGRALGSMATMATQGGQQMVGGGGVGIGVVQRWFWSKSNKIAPAPTEPEAQPTWVQHNNFTLETTLQDAQEKINENWIEANRYIKEGNIKLDLIEFYLKEKTLDLNQYEAKLQRINESLENTISHFGNALFYFEEIIETSAEKYSMDTSLPKEILDERLREIYLRSDQIKNSNSIAKDYHAHIEARICHLNLLLKKNKQGYERVQEEDQEMTKRKPTEASPFEDNEEKLDEMRKRKLSEMIADIIRNCANMTKFKVFIFNESNVAKLSPHVVKEKLIS